MNLTATLIPQIVVFGVLVWFIRQFLWDPVLRILEDRKKRVADGLAAAERGHHEKELADRHARKTIHDAKEQAAAIINQAHKRAGEIVEESKDNARTEGERLISAAQSEIDQEKNRAREQLRKEVTKIALAGVEKILMREVDATAHNKVFEELTSQL
uniref:ATP synthase subunit b n=1 Tax=Candidatus Kentrum sp. DK TaxID=2126562 RepID=A0A450RUM4_9GAMM|nr:MAG: F-type H+-transporting ATPase subunit b [Candidatus Kentron sp. DK]VFJ47037.1 MAG: F-type H+-transporting ATPase subunit b [Candidatus Kentron sp. DK]